MHVQAVSASNSTDVLTPAASAPLQLKLVIASGPDFGREVPLAQGTYRIGKEAGNEIVLSDSAVSRTHLLLEVLRDGVRLTDNNSTNGCFHDGVRFSSL